MADVLQRMSSTAFPAAEVEARIRQALADQAADQAILRPDRMAKQNAPRSWEPEIDSLVAVEIICVIEELLGIDLPATFAPKGGYDSAEACVNDLMSEARAAWTQRTIETESEAAKEMQTHEQ